MVAKYFGRIGVPAVSFAENRQIPLPEPADGSR